MSEAIAADGRALEVDGRPTFLLIDTVWSAFTHAGGTEWDNYLDARAAQGFNAVQISVLPILDDTPEPGLETVFRGGTDVFGDDIAPEYLERASDLVARVRARGMTPLLVLLWHNYVPGWGSEQDPAARCIELDHVDGYVRRIVATFGASAPVYLASGDADFADPRAVAIFTETARAVRRHAPRALLSTHPSADQPIAPADLDEQLDFLMFQSGHDPAAQNLAYQHAETILGADRYRLPRPLLNGEPCYEGIGYAFRYGRFLAHEVRRAMWHSVLAGATAGVAYAAHGTWQWYREGGTYKGAHFASSPFDFLEALSFPGATDAGTLRSLVEEFGLMHLLPRQDLLQPILPNPDPRQTPPPVDDSVRAAASNDHRTVAVYLPTAAAIWLGGIDLTAHTIRAFNLTTRDWAHITCDTSSDRTRFGMPQSPGDWLYVCTIG